MEDAGKGKKESPPLQIGTFDTPPSLIAEYSSAEQIQLPRYSRNLPTHQDRRSRLDFYTIYVQEGGDRVGRRRCQEV